MDSTGRPAHLAATENVAVQVWNGFATVPPVVDDEPVTVLIQAERGGNLRSLKEQVPKESLVVDLGEGQAGDAFLGNYQSMDWSLGVGVMKCQDEVILVNDSGRYFSGEYLFEDGLAHRNADGRTATRDLFLQSPETAASAKPK